MQDNERSHVVCFQIDEELAKQFKRAAEENGNTAEDVLLGFIKDYVVSSGHPEQVVNGWPWSKLG